MKSNDMHDMNYLIGELVDDTRPSFIKIRVYIWFTYVQGYDRRTAEAGHDAFTTHHR